MKKSLIIIILIVIIFSWQIITSFYRHIGEIRPIKIKVINSHTKQPISNIEVVYKLISAKNSHFLGFQLLDNFEYPTIIKEKTMTDSEGVVYFPKRKVSLRLYEEIYREYIYINLLPIEKVGEEPDNPIKNLKGIFIESSKFEIPPDTYRTLTHKKFNHILNNESLSKGSDELIVVLENIEK